MDYHVLEQSLNGDSCNTVFHYPVPDTTNSVGFPIRTIIAEEFNKDLSGVADATEEAQLISGEVLEYSSIVRYKSTSTLAQKRAAIEDKYNTTKVKINKIINNQYDFYGYKNNV